MLQPHDTADESGFGMENVPELMLDAYLDENGDYMGPQSTRGGSCPAGIPT